MISFLGESGIKWSFNESHPIGDPSGMGQVFQGSRAGSNGQVAIKRVSLRFGSTRERRRRDREVEIGRLLLGASGAEVDKVHLLLPLDHTYLNDDLYIVMPLAQGSLAAALRGQMSETSKIGVLHDVANGLMQLASMGVLHRDLKPANVLLVDEVWKLADFGISRNLEESTGTYTFLGAGTFPYMAPELWRGQPATAKSDLYALGVMAYEVLTGARPFNGPGEKEYREQHLHSSPPSLGALHPAVIRLVQRLLRKDPAERPQDARAVLEALDDYLMVLNPDQEALLKAVQIRERQQAESEARQSKADGVEQARLGLHKQAIGDLDHILQAAAERARTALPEIRYSARSFSEDDQRSYLRSPAWQGEFQLGFITIWFQVWPDNGTSLLLGDITYKLPPLDTKVAANIFYEEHEGRYRWFLIQDPYPARYYNDDAVEFLIKYRRDPARNEQVTVSVVMSVLSEIIENGESGLTSLPRWKQQ